MLDYIDKNYSPGKKDIVAEYYIEPDGVSFEKACEHVAGESSIGTWTTISTMNPKIARTLKPKVYDIDKKSKIVKIAYPEELFEPGNMPEILSSIAGNIFGMKSVRNLKLLDIHFTKNIMKGFKGPKFGVSGVRKLTGVKKRPLVGTIVKPKVGLDEKQHAKVAYEAWIGGLDVVKDDENLSSMSFNNFYRRALETIKLKKKAEKETGEKKIYMANVTAETFEMIRRAEYLKKLGNEYMMLDIITLGFSAVQTMRDMNEKLDLVMHAHRAMHGAITRNPKHGISMLTLSKCARLIGVDQLHIGTAAVGKMHGSKSEELDVLREIEHDEIKAEGQVLRQEWHGIKPVFAVASGGLSPLMVPELIKIMGNDIIIQAGGGVHGHPEGTRAGAKAMRDAVEAAMKGERLKGYSKELDMAFKKWA